ncbi:hypothetical protein JYP51_09480 [Ponticoccus gilvus]|nr:hypothetical protein [Enemella evansiae]
MNGPQAIVAGKLLAQGFSAHEIAEVLGVKEDAVRALPGGGAKADAGDPLRALVYLDRNLHRADRHPGSIWISEAGPGELGALWFFCPCGCVMLNRITVGHRFKPKSRGPSWNWNGSRSEPSLTPSVNQQLCKWHGWLRDGYWERC